eukprot:SAG31_NODE_3103_length_4672_cov_2.447409_2_plen_349_part_00
MLDSQQLDELDRRGFTILPHLIDAALCSRARNLMDTIIGGPPPSAQGEIGLETVPLDRRQGGPWPKPGDDRPVITCTGFKHSISHPIRDSMFGHPGIMGELLLPFVEINRQLLWAPHSGDGGMKLLQQEMRRTDVRPPPHHGCHAPWLPPKQWHMDQAFLPQHYAASPRQNFYHTILALSPFTRNGGAFFAVPTSLEQARSLTAAMSAAQKAEITTVPDRTRTLLRQRLSNQVDRSAIVELELAEGDLLILDPMVMHSASDVATRSRYALFTSFFHAAAIGTTMTGLRQRVAAAPGALKFPLELKRALPEQLWPLLDWTLPSAVEDDVPGLVQDLTPTHKKGALSARL